MPTMREWPCDPRKTSGHELYWDWDVERWRCRRCGAEWEFHPERPAKDRPYGQIWDADRWIRHLIIRYEADAIEDAIEQAQKGRARTEIRAPVFGWVDWEG